MTTIPTESRIFADRYFRSLPGCARSAAGRRSESAPSAPQSTARNGGLDQTTFTNCLKPFALTYFDFYNRSYIGLAEALQAGPAQGQPNLAADQFPFIQRVIFNDTSDANKKAIGDEVKGPRH
jgi:hypothetical protein